MALTKGRLAPRAEAVEEVEAVTEAVKSVEREAAVEPEDRGEPEKKEVATTKKSSGIAATGGSLAGAIAKLAEHGFGDLDLGWGAFPTIALNGQMFESSDGHNVGNAFEAIIVRKACKTLHKGSDRDDDEKEEVVYTFDGEVTTNGEDLAEIRASWREKDYKVEKKDYYDVLVQVTNGSMEGMIAILSIPPTSRRTLDGYSVGTMLTYDKAPEEVVTKVFVGNKVTKAIKPYYPWAFECVSLVE